MNIACHVKQSSKTTSFGGTLSWQWRGGMSSVRVVQTVTTRILWHRFPGTCETVGQVFKFVWRLYWKINAVCMSLSPLVSFKSRFVTYLLNFPRMKQLIRVNGKTIWSRVSEERKSTGDCPYQYGYFRLGDSRNCGQFMNCVDGRGYVFDCPEGLAFNQDTYQCDWADEVESCDAEG